MHAKLRPARGRLAGRLHDAWLGEQSAGKRGSGSRQRPCLGGGEGEGGVGGLGEGGAGGLGEGGDGGRGEGGAGGRGEGGGLGEGAGGGGAAGAGSCAVASTFQNVAA